MRGREDLRHPFLALMRPARGSQVPTLKRRCGCPEAHIELAIEVGSLVTGGNGRDDTLRAKKELGPLILRSPLIG